MSGVVPLMVILPLNEGRGPNPGDTYRPVRRRPPGRASLNEGRGSNPGDTLRHREEAADQLDRQQLQEGARRRLTRRGGREEAVDPSRLRGGEHRHGRGPVRSEIIRAQRRQPVRLPQSNGGVGDEGSRDDRASARAVAGVDLEPLRLGGQRHRRWQHRWRRERRRRRVEAKLDKVALLASRQGDFRTGPPGFLPEATKRSWREAANELIEASVDWEFTVNGATVRCKDSVMTVRWGNFWVLAPPDVRSGNWRTSAVPGTPYWFPPDGNPYVATEGPVIGGQPAPATPRSAG